MDSSKNHDTTLADLERVEQEKLEQERLAAEEAALADAAKKKAAVSSVLWSALLTVIKLIAGISTNSLGLLSEALHSTLDFVAAGITCLAVRISAQPADERHPYGHGKAESLAALAETVLLLVTCAWIIIEAVERLFFSAGPVEPSWWAFGVVIVSRHAAQGGEGTQVAGPRGRRHALHHGHLVFGRGPCRSDLRGTCLLRGS